MFYALCIICCAPEFLNALFVLEAAVVLAAAAGVCLVVVVVVALFPLLTGVVLPPTSLSVLLLSLLEVARLLSVPPLPLTLLAARPRAGAYTKALN